MSLSLGTLKIGNVTPRLPLILAPMAGVTDRVMRKISSEHGAALTVSEMISAKGVYYGDKKTDSLAGGFDGEYPYALQIFGSSPEIVAYAARELIIRHPEISVIDVNMGCPMPKITGNGEGSALMKTPELAGRIVRALKDAVKVPVTVKMRTGWDKNSVNAPLVAAICEDSGADMICVHGRTREQLYRPPVDLETIGAVKKSVGIPVVGNGGIYSASDALLMFEKTGCDGVAVAQGAMGNPWIFDEISAALEGRSCRAPEKDEIIATAVRHVRMLCEDKGEYIGVREARKHLGWYIKGFEGAASARAAINSASGEDELICELRELLRSGGTRG